jgi:hypothetical protein
MNRKERINEIITRTEPESIIIEIITKVKLGLISIDELKNELFKLYNCGFDSGYANAYDIWA